MASTRTRLDQLCVERGLAPTRQRAQALIQAGKVLLDGQPATKAGTRVPADAELTLRQPDHPYVSRGGLKLQGALDHFALDVTDVAALDVGASTGGFTDCLLQRGARHVIAVDVGRGQLDWRLRNDPRVTCIERYNARHLRADDLRRRLADPTAWPPALAVIDVSFISLRLVLPPLLQPGLLVSGAPLVALIKPQFEAPRRHVGKGGVVRDPQLRQQAIDGVLDGARQHGLELVGSCPSPVAGPRGNVEQLCLLRRP